MLRNSARRCVAASLLLIVLLPMLATAAEPAADAAKKPKIAFFPLGGSSKQALRDQIGFALRAKLDRAGKYEVIDGPRMVDLAAESKEAITLDTPADAIKELAKIDEPNILVWGQSDPGGGGTTIKLNILDLRDPAGKPAQVTKVIKQPTDMRFVIEEILETLPGVEKFAHPVEESVWDDAKAQEMWKKQPNLVYNGDFSEPGKWEAIYMAEKYPVEISDKLPAVDKVNIYKLVENGKTNNVLAMNLSKDCAENNGMACLSERIEISSGTRYRLAFRYKSDGPTLHVFVKGYTKAPNIKGEIVDREIYRRQVPPSGPTNGKWVEVVDDLNPQHVAFPVQYLRVDLYAYLGAGSVMFDDVVLKAVGKQTRKAEDDAIKKPVSRPQGAK
ncbi:MAG: hypothetical protein ABSH20_10110 [Tepidisphaeraceae bacterium]